jgi:hypothetical protein
MTVIWFRPETRKFINCPTLMKIYRCLWLYNNIMELTLSSLGPVDRIRPGASEILEPALILGDFICGHRVPWHRLTGAFVAYNRRHLKSWVGNYSEGSYWTKWGQTKYCRDFSRFGPIAVPHVSIFPFHVSFSVSICVAIRYNGVSRQRCTVKI